MPSAVMRMSKKGSKAAPSKGRYFEIDIRNLRLRMNSGEVAAMEVGRRDGKDIRVKEPVDWLDSMIAPWRRDSRLLKIMVDLHWKCKTQIT